MLPAELIAHKRDGRSLSDGQIRDFIQQYTRGDIPDYQMSALAMAVYFQGMTLAETVALTQAMLDSGQSLQWSTGAPCVDKHSTGGVGDKISLVLAPLLACCGLRVPMLSGRGLGITGGTLDKLESISGFRTDLSLPEIQQQTQQTGCVITGTSQEIVPADRKLYALRDVTGTVPSPPLIVASILSKKLAESLDALVLDVKCGAGAFMQTQPQAQQLATLLVQVAGEMGVPATALMTDMNQPVGQAVGNVLEVEESLALLDGQGPADARELTLRLGEESLLACGASPNAEVARQRLIDALDSGAARERFEQMVAAQGGRLSELAKTPPPQTYCSDRAGYVASVDARRLGQLIVELGGGRRLMSDSIDHGVGARVLVRVGQQVAAGEPMLELYSRQGRSESFAADTLFRIESSPPHAPPLVIDRVCS